MAIELAGKVTNIKYPEGRLERVTVGQCSYGFIGIQNILLL